MAKEEQKVQLTFDPTVTKSYYTNCAQVIHSAYEIRINFAQLVPGRTSVPFDVSVAMSPQHAKALQQALSDNIANFEQKFGKITPAKPPEVAIGFKAEGETG